MCNGRMAFHVPIFTKLINAQQYQYVQMLCTKFYPNGTISMESVNIYVSLSKAWLTLRQFSQSYNHSDIFIDIYTKFY